MENILSVDLSSETSPVVQEVRGRDYIEYGTEEWRNLYPQFLIDLYYNSSTHAAIINTTAEMIAGEDIVVEESENLEQFVKLKKFFAEANGKESLHEVIKKLSFDFKLQGAFAIHIIWNKAKTEIAEIYHVPVERVRASRPNSMGVVDCFYVCSDWGNTRTNKPVKIAAFNTKDRTNPSQLLYSGLYSPNMDIYHTPDYLAANNWALVDQRVAEFHLNNISNGFSGSYMISFANGVPSQEERYQIEQSLAAKFTGASNSGKFVLTFSDDKTRTPEITPITVSNADKQYLALQELLVQNILTGHRVTSPMLMGIKNDTGLGSNVDEMNAAFEIYLNTVVVPYQKHILKTLSKIFEVNGMNLPISFVQAKPITSKFTIEDMKEVMTQDEIRAELGLKPLTDEELTAEDDNYNLEKVGTIVSDGKELPLFDSIEEAEAEAEKIGCSGSHSHTQDGKEYFMPCADHDQLINLKDCDCGKKKECDKSCYEKTELDAFLETVEDIPEGWELIDEEVVDGEHADFDFEEELNQIAAEKIELATTGVARPDSKSEQDGISKKTYDYYRVRYVYAQDNFLTRKSGKKRDFCQKMMEAKKLYRKEDIARMSTKRVNPGWGKGGADTYDIFLYKGGGNCHHFFLRQIYRTELGISVSTKIKDADLVGYTKARSEGFTAKKNDKRVAIAPKRMKNNGFVKRDNMAYVLFISEDKLKDSTAINMNVDVNFLLPFVKQAQKLYVETKLGTDLNQKLKDLIIAGTVNAGGNEYYKTLLNTYIGDMLPNFALYHAIPFLRFKIENGNIYSKTSENGVALTTEESQHLRSEVLNTGEYYMERMIEYIKNNISRFPEYNTNSGADVTPDSNAYYAGMNLERPQGQGNKITLRDFLTPDLT